MTNSRTRTVPSSPLARVFGFGQLAAGLAMGTVAEAVRQSVGGGDDGRVGGRGGEHASRKRSGTVKQYVVSDANAERLAETLCRMRGAALKLGQMLSIQVRQGRGFKTKKCSCKLQLFTEYCTDVLMFFKGWDLGQGPKIRSLSVVVDDHCTFACRQKKRQQGRYVSVTARALECECPGK